MLDFLKSSFLMLLSVGKNVKNNLVVHHQWTVLKLLSTDDCRVNVGNLNFALDISLTFFQLISLNEDLLGREGWRGGGGGGGVWSRPLSQ